MSENVLQVYETGDGKAPFQKWFERLSAPAALRVTTALKRLETGHRSALKSVGAGVLEYRIQTGPGYRVYCAYDGTTLIILLSGGTKQRQSADIAQAKAYWQDYKKRKKREP